MLSESKFEKEGLTFDDVLLIPGKSDVTPNMINLGTRLAGGITLKTPIMTAAMDTVTEAKNGNSDRKRRRNRNNT